jgi:two-component system response regulator PilR (NtrC family)
VKILVVDDEPDFLATCVRLLALMGHEAVTTTNAPDGAARIEAGGIDLVITDMRMGGNGRAVAGLARRASPPVPVIVVTGYPSLETVEAARRANAILLPKPVDPRELRSAIHRTVPPSSYEAR